VPDAPPLGNPESAPGAPSEAGNSQHIRDAIPLGPEIGEKWLRGRYSGPYLRDSLLDAGAFVETLETAAFWSRLPQLYRAVRDAFGDTFLVLCHVSHVYETGASLYFTAVGPMITTARWSEVKSAVSDAILANGGTITHHHGVGTDHRDWYVREVGELAIDTLRSAKHRLDPHGILNPGVLIPLP
jgi:alkyldihydroxyacetonephosphate synthase